MKKILSFLLLATLVACSKDSEITNAPITVTGADMMAIYKPGTKLNYYDMDVSKVFVPSEGANQTWDYRNAKSTTGEDDLDELMTPPANKSFPTATYAVEYESEGLFDLSFKIRDFYEISSSGWYFLGEFIEAKTLKLPNGVVLSSLGEEEVFDPKLTEFAFPLTYGKTYKSYDSIVESYVITVPSLNLSNAPVRRVVYKNQDFKVSGWGKILLPDYNSPIEVLQVHALAKSWVRYYVNGKPAPTALLTSMGLVDGEIFYESFYEFISKKYGVVANVNFESDPNGGTSKVVIDTYYEKIE